MCDTFVVVGDDGVLFAKNSDRDPNEAQVLSWVPAREHPAGSTLACTWRQVPQVRRTHALILSRPYWMWGAEMGANEHGVVIGNEAVFTDADFAEDGLTGMDLLRLALERASTAADAAQQIRALNAAHGQGGRCGYSNAGFRYHSSFLVADRQEAWVVETAGRDSALERVTRGVRAISNAVSLDALRERERWPHPHIGGGRKRRARVECLATRVRDAAQAARVLADHGERGVIEWHWWNGALHAPCVHGGGLLAASQTTGSWISELRRGGDRHWASGTSAPCLGLFRPLSFAEARDTGRPTGAPDADSLWWRHERLHRAVMRSPGALPATFGADRERTQRAIFAGEADGWNLAEDWLCRWERWPGAGREARAWWLRRYWRGVEREAAAGALLPWRNA